MNTVRANLYSSRLPLTPWDYAVHAAFDTYNHTSHDATAKLPTQMYSTKKPIITTLLAFGTPGHIQNSQKLTKLQARVTNLQYIGRQDFYQYCVYDPQTRTVSRCRAADFMYMTISKIQCPNNTQTQPTISSHHPPKVLYTRSLNCDV